MRTGDSPASPGTGHPSRWTSIALALIATAVAGGLWSIGWLPAVDRVSGDVLLRFTASRSDSEAPVTAIVIDDAALERYGPLPWPRNLLARIAQAAFDSGARALAVDLILAEPGTGDDSLARVLDTRPVAIGAAIDAAGSWLLPLEAFGGIEVAAHVYGEVGPDGVVRTISATKQAHGVSLPALSLAGARLLRPDLPVEPGRELRPEFRPAPQQLQVVTATSALEGSLSRPDIKERLVFLGITATGAGDQFVVPTGPGHAPVPGVLAHASAAASILDGRLLRRLGPLWSGMTALALAWGVQLLRDRRGAFDLVRFSALLAGLGAVAVVAVRAGLVLVPVAALAVTMVISALLREAVESRLTHLETGRLLQIMTAHSADAPPRTMPRTARARLEALRQVQGRVLSEDATRKALLAGMTEGVVLWNAAGDLLEANPAARRLWGHVPTLDEIVSAGGPGGSEAIQHRRGSYELSIVVTNLDANRLAIIRDVTAERTLERRRRDMQRLVSHELKTPLASIAGFGESLERYELSRDELSRVAGMIRGEAGRLQDMVTAFLDLERLGSGHWEEEVGFVDFGALAAERVEVLAAAAAARGISITPSIEPGGRVRGVRTLLDRVVDNLVGNAIKYSHAGDAIEVGARRRDDRMTLTVRDHGPGIPAESLERIFERFYRVPGAKGSGAGLGLALVKEIVDWHGGCMKIDSGPGVGSAFTVSLPISEEA